jgi:hypothetical protein
LCATRAARKLRAVLSVSCGDAANCCELGVLTRSASAPPGQRNARRREAGSAGASDRPRASGVPGRGTAGPRGLPQRGHCRRELFPPLRPRAVQRGRAPGRRPGTPVADGPVRGPTVPGRLRRRCRGGPPSRCGRLCAARTGRLDLEVGPPGGTRPAGEAPPPPLRGAGLRAGVGGVGMVPPHPPSALKRTGCRTRPVPRRRWPGR